MNAQILLQLHSTQTTNGWDTAIMALLSISLLIFLSMTGRIQLGFQIPGFSSPLYRNRKKILSQYFGYYSTLDETEKKKFERRVQAFIHSKTFHGRGVVVNDEMRVLISACAVQLTFGLPGIMLSHFKRIIIYPNDYYSTINKQYHRGEINPRLKAIVLSWEHFVKGYIDHDSGINLGLHEMAHALHLENVIMNREYDFLNRDALEQWQRMADTEMKKIQENSESHFFRSYAGINHHEFFAISVENFFEKSTQFEQELPEFYQLMTLILCQNPNDRLNNPSKVG